MLKLFSGTIASRPFCDRVSRRGFLQIGALGLGGLTLPQLLELEAAAGEKRSH